MWTPFWTSVCVKAITMTRIVMTSTKNVRCAQPKFPTILLNWLNIKPEFWPLQKSYMCKCQCKTVHDAANKLLCDCLTIHWRFHFIRQLWYGDWPYSIILIGGLCCCDDGDKSSQNPRHPMKVVDPARVLEFQLLADERLNAYNTYI